MHIFFLFFFRAVIVKANISASHILQVFQRKKIYKNMNGSFSRDNFALFVVGLRKIPARYIDSCGFVWRKYTKIHTA